MRLRQVGAAVRGLLSDPASQLARAAGSDGLTGTEHLLFLILDELRIANWQRTKDGRKGRNRPRRVSPLARNAGSVRFGKTDRSPEEVAAYLARFDPHAKGVEDR